MGHPVSRLFADRLERILFFTSAQCSSRCTHFRTDFAFLSRTSLTLVDPLPLIFVLLRRLLRVL